MSITASRFGTSALMLDWSGLNLLAPELQSTQKDHYLAQWKSTLQDLHEWKSGFYDCAIDPSLNQLEACLKQIEALRETPSLDITDCLFIGIGGSSLGPMCLIDSLKHRALSIKFHFFENPDPLDWQYRIARLTPKNTLVCVVTKSGTTYETLAIFMLAHQWLSRALGTPAAQKQIIAITDPEKGELRELCLKEGISMLSIHPSVGGRYSIFTPVGLFAGALAGLDMRAFLNGAKKKRDYC